MPNRSITVDGGDNQSTFDSNRNILYTATADGISRWDATTGAMLPPISIPGGNRSVAVSADGQYLVVGRMGHTLASDGARVLHLVRVNLDTGEQTDLAVKIVSYSAETIVEDVVITAGGTVIFSTQSEHSGAMPIRSFSLMSANPPTITEIGSAHVGAPLVISPDRTQVMILNDNVTWGGFGRWQDGMTRATWSDLGRYGSSSGGTGGGDVANNGMMIRVGMTDTFVIVDRDFNLIKNMSQVSWTRGYADGQFSDDGRLMFAYGHNTKLVDVYDTTTWTLLKSIALPPAAQGDFYSGYIDLIGNGEFLVVGQYFHRHLLDLTVNLDLTLAGTAADDALRGYLYADTITGAAGADVLDGDAGDDRLSGGDGDDRLIGGRGSDVLDGGAGIDTADYSAATAGVTARLDVGAASNDGQGGTDTLIDIENLRGSAFNDTLIGNAGANRLEGGRGRDVLLGLDGDDILVGGEGEANELYGGTGNDRYIISANDSVIENAGEGIDTVETSILGRYTLGANIENLIYTGASAFEGVGNALANTITGGSGDDTLIGRGGSDILMGGAGSDTADYSLSGEGVTVRIDLSIARDGEGGFDTLNSIENATGSAFDDLLFGDAAANVLRGGLGLDSIFGQDGDDLIYGGEGVANELHGGRGDDTYIVEVRGDSIIEQAGEGFDTVRTALFQVNLSANVEALTYTGTETFTGVGNQQANVITGGLMRDTLIGLGGDDILIGGAGAANELYGGQGDDRYILAVADTIIETENEGVDTVETATLAGYVLGRNVENLIYTGTGAFRAVGNELANVLTGGIGADTLVGGAGNDRLVGGAGIDTADYAAAAGAVIVDLSAGTASNDGDGGVDTLVEIENVAGSAFADQITGDNGANQLLGGNGDDILRGGGGDDILHGGAGVNQLFGGVGNDRYVVTSTDDVITELAGEGTDIVETALAAYTLAANVETLIYTGSGVFRGTGNAGDNTLVGGVGNDILAGGSGADTLNGGEGHDTLAGDNGNDILNGGAGDDFLVGGLGSDRLDGGAGTDTADYSAYGIGVGVSLMTNTSNEGDTLVSIENLIGSAFADTLYGNAGDNRLEGGAGNDTLFSGGGADHLLGGTGDDIYHVWGAEVTITEQQNEGSDTVVASLSRYTLGANVEHLVFNYNFGAVGFGNALNNMITGGNGNDILVGIGGNDTLNGGNGSDSVVMSGVRSEYTITAIEGGYRIVDTIDGRDGTDTLRNIEEIVFSDGTVLALGTPPAAPVAEVMPQLSDKAAFDDAFVLPALSDDDALVLPALATDKAFDADPLVLPDQDGGGFVFTLETDLGPIANDPHGLHVFENGALRQGVGHDWG